MSTTSLLTSQSGQFPVYTGMWTNWSRGYILGATLTLHRRDADLLIAFTAFFISFIATRVWRILCFIFHQSYSTANPQDLIYHQRQAILRNSSSPESGVQMLTQLLWKNRRSHNWARPLPAALAATLCLAAFIIAGGFSSQISTALGNEVLIKSLNCGRANRWDIGFVNGSNPNYVHLATKVHDADKYAQQCYSDDSGGIVDCARYVKSSIPRTIDNNATCPFHNDVCRNQSENLYIDSDYIDSHSIFGLNTPIAERIQFRNVLHCAPLATTRFTSEKNISVGLTTQYHYGSRGSLEGEMEDYIFAAKSIESQYSDVSSADFTVESANFHLESFGVHVRQGLPFRDRSAFIPIGAINRQDADTFIVFLVGNGVVFGEPSLDPWYRATTLESILSQSIDPAVEMPYYIPDEPASPLCCAEQYQFCNSMPNGTRHCGPLTGRLDAIAGAALLFDSTYDGFNIPTVTTEEAALFIYFTSMLSDLSIGVKTVVSNLGPAALDSQQKLISGFQGSIPPNQWQLDVTHWWDVVMAGRQWDMLETAYLPPTSDTLGYRLNFTDKIYQKLCNNQKIRSTEYASFSLFGLIITFSLGFLTALASFLLEPVSEALHKKRGYKKQYAHLEWTTNSALQLQRLAHEELGFGTWSEVTETVPITKAGELLGSLDIANLDHPTLCRPLNPDDGMTLHVHSDSSAEFAVNETLPHTPAGDGAPSAQQRPALDLDTIPPAEELASEVGEAFPIATTDSGPESAVTKPTSGPTTVRLAGHSGETIDN